MKYAQKNNGQKGQVAIFIALIFQVLFLFFAMIINVGLLVHHKINLQNSVDLAAYYGAMRQGETLNAIGHINYQIRQSWKLLSWRYRQLGTAGNFSAAHPFDKPNKRICLEPDCKTESISPNPDYNSFYDQPAFCITYAPFKPMPPGENTCRNSQDDYHEIPTFKPPAIYAPFISASTAINAMSKAFLRAMNERCQTIGPFNYITLARFVATFSMDQAEKKLMIRHLAMGLSDNTQDFMDLDGESGRAGMVATLKGNLTGPNRDSLNETSDVEIFNSLATADCGSAGINDKYAPPKWLSEVKIYPGFTYVDTTCTDANHPDNSRIITTRHTLDDEPVYGGAQYSPEFHQEIVRLKNFVSGYPDAPYNFSMGYEKNPWCMAYVGVAARTTPKIPFAPLGNVTLVARAFAKPFGGKIGPWFGETWPVTSSQSVDSEGHRTDENLPPRVTDPASLGPVLTDTRRFANYSKYPGDKFGMKSRLTLGQYGQAIYAIDKDFRNTPYAAVAPGYPNPDDADAPNFKHWDHLAHDFKEAGNGDILAWDDKTKAANPMRNLEIIAIAPDIFDITYYSIEPDYFNLYFKRIRDGYLPKRTGYNYLPRADLGSRVGDSELESFSIKDQMKVVRNAASTRQDGQVDIENQLTYIALTEQNPPAQRARAPLLTSWLGKSLSDYSLDIEGFGHCNTPPAPNSPTSGDCVGKGRTGYAVKLVSEDYLKSSSQPIGGVNAGLGKIKNAPEPDLFQNILSK
jgi:hypothetical protein